MVTAIDVPPSRISSGSSAAKRVRAKRCDPVVDVKHLPALRNPSHTTQGIRAGSARSPREPQLDDA